MSQKINESGRGLFSSEKFSWPMIDVSLSCDGDRVYGWPEGILQTQWLRRMVFDEPVVLVVKKLSRHRRRLQRDE